jgi:SAM-dependent methyltransferase
MTTAELYTRLYLESDYGLKRATFGGEVHEWLLANTPPPCEVLEFGAGRGYMAAHLSRLGYCVTATELSEDIIALWPPGPARRLCALPGGADGFEDESFDVILALDVLEHLQEHGQVRKTLEQIKRITRRYAVLTVGLTPARSGGCLPGTDEDLHSQLHLTDWWCRAAQQCFRIIEFYRRKDCLYIYASKDT